MYKKTSVFRICGSSAFAEGKKRKKKVGKKVGRGGARTQDFRFADQRFTHYSTPSFLGNVHQIDVYKEPTKNIFRVREKRYKKDLKVIPMQ